MIFETKPKLLSIGIITLSKEMISLLNVGVLKIRNIGEFNLERRTSDQIVMELEPLIVKSKDVCVKPQVSLKDKVYPETYYHHSQDDIQVDETPTRTSGF